jgi:photosystem II stability/assembly factor-like uncharacterized protein
LFKNSLQGLAIPPSDLTGALATTDGGLTWANADLMDTFDFPYYNAFASSGDGAYLMYGDLGGIYSSDNGMSWSKIAPTPSDSSSPFPNQKPATHFLFQISALGQENAYMIVKYIDTTIGLGNSQFSYHTHIFETSNAGQSWPEMKNAPATPICLSVHFRTPTIGYMGCDSGTVYRTTDGGDNWTRSILTGDHAITAIGFLNDTIGFCGSNIAQIFRTTDGGISWQNDSLRIGNDGTSKNVSEYFDQILFPDSNTVIATTRNGFYRRKLNSTPPAIVDVGSGGPLFQYLYVKLYPTPTSNMINVELDGMYIAPPGTLSCGLYDILGHHVLDLSAEAQHGNNGYTSLFSFNVNNLSDGVYTLDYSLGGFSYSHSVVVIH